jgi:nuclear pore complex protein Nup93
MPNLQLQSKMMVYDRVIIDLNAARLRETSHPVFHALIEASLSIAVDVNPLSIDR